jgi:hypothetical protein
MDKKLISNEIELKEFHENETKGTYSDNWQYFDKPLKYPCIIIYTEIPQHNANKDHFEYDYVYLDDFNKE